MKRVVNNSTGALVEFVMNGDVVEATWKHEGFRAMFEDARISARGGEFVTMADGRAFFDALPAHFERSSTHFVEDQE